MSKDKQKHKKHKTHFQLPVLPCFNLNKITESVEDMADNDEVFKNIWRYFLRINEAYLKRRGGKLPAYEAKALCAFFMGIGMGRTKAVELVRKQELGELSVTE